MVYVEMNRMYIKEVKYQHNSALLVFTWQLVPRSEELSSKNYPI